MQQGSYQRSMFVVALVTTSFVRRFLKTCSKMKPETAALSHAYTRSIGSRISNKSVHPVLSHSVNDRWPSDQKNPRQFTCI